MTTIKKLCAVLALCAGVSFGPMVAHADTYGDLALKAVNARSWWVQASSGSSVAMELWYTGSSTEAVVTITSTTFIMYAPANVVDRYLDISASAYDTLGELCDYLDGLGNWGCSLLGGKRNDNTTRMLDQLAVSGTNDLKAAGGFRVEFDTAPLSEAVVDPGAIGDDTDYDLRVWASPSNKSNRIVLKACEWNVNGTSNTDFIGVYGKSVDRSMEVHIPPLAIDATLGTQTLVWRKFITDDTDGTHDFTVNGSLGLMFAPGENVVVSGGNGTSVQAANAQFLRCLFEER